MFKDFITKKVSAVQPAIGVGLVFALAVAICTTHPATAQQSDAQSLKNKLEQKVQFRPKADAPLDQLIEVAKTFQIPMGIEWSDSAKCNAPPATSRTQETVLERLNAIVRRCPAQRLTVEQGMVHVHSRFAQHPRNILNLRIWRFQMKDGSVFDAGHQLRLAIDMQLHPNRYAGGYNGGHGSPGDHPFSIPIVSFSGNDIRVRDVLDGIVKSSGNAFGWPG